MSIGTTSLVDMNRRGNYETLNLGMFLAGWNALQLGFVSSVPNPKHRLPRHGTSQPWSRGKGEMVHPLDKLVRKDIGITNRNPADFTVIIEKNNYMRKMCYGEECCSSKAVRLIHLPLSSNYHL